MKTTTATLLLCTILGLPVTVNSGPGFPGVIHSPRGTPNSAGSLVEAGVTCDKCKATWVLEPDTKSGMKLTAYSHRKAATCPSCDRAALRFFKNGKLPGLCKHCGGTMTQSCANLLEDTGRVVRSIKP